jgi:hypothetical protein
MNSATTGSAHHAPNSAFRQSREKCPRQVGDSRFCLPSLAVAEEAIREPMRCLARPRSGITTTLPAARAIPRVRAQLRRDACFSTEQPCFSPCRVAAAAQFRLKRLAVSESASTIQASKRRQPPSGRARRWGPGPALRPPRNPRCSGVGPARGRTARTAQLSPALREWCAPNRGERPPCAPAYSASAGRRRGWWLQGGQTPILRRRPRGPPPRSRRLGRP